MRRRRGGRGQSLVEMAMIMPMVILVALGGTDLAVAYGYASDVAGSARAGMRIGIQGEAFDIGDAVRTEPSNVLQNNSTEWGNEAAGGSNGNCVGSGSGVCGAANGCSPADFIANQLACFAIRSCQVDSASNRCTAYGAWGSRPDQGNAPFAGLEVVVVYRYYPKTPAITQLTGNGSAFYLTATSVGLELYF
ncbi:MAG: TadE/TadG family type IV pilus assembly protein [Candidatus Dormibacteria bacterium]